MKAKKQLLKEYIMKTNLYSTLSISKRVENVIKIINNTHPNELLIYNEFITPRGIDFIQEVILNAHEQYTTLHLNTLKEKQMLFKKLNYEWTKLWVNRICIWNSVSYSFIFSKDMKIINFAILYEKDINALNQLIKRHPELKQYILIKDKEKYISSVGLNYIISNYYIDDEIKRMSSFISFNLKHLKSEYDFINFKEYKKINVVKAVKKSNEKMYDSKIVIKESMGSNTYYDFINTIKRMHPHENMIVSLKENNDKFTHGEIKLTSKGMNWFQNIYLKFRTDQELFINKDIKNSLNYLKENNIDDYSFDDISFQDLANINCISEKQIEDIIFNFYRNCLLQNENNICYLSKEGLIALESDYPIFQLRHLSFHISQKISDDVEFKNNKINKENSNKYLLEVEDLLINKTYKGTIIRNFSTVGNDSLTKIITFNVCLENHDTKEVKLRIPYSILQEKKIYQMFLSFTPITFEIEEIEGGHKRIKWFRLYQKMMYKLNWDQCLLEYVAVEKVGRKKGGRLK